MKIDHIYCLNLERSAERRKNMEKEFEKEELEVEFFKACDGKAIGRDGVYGNAESNIKIYKDIVEKGYENALILEDDIELIDDFKNKINELCEPEDWDILYIYSLGRILYEEHNQHFLKGVSLSTAGYIISNKCAKKLQFLEYDDFGCPLDLFIAVNLKLKTFIAKDKLIKDSYTQSISDIGMPLSRFFERRSLEHWTRWSLHNLPILEILLVILVLTIYFINANY